MVKKLWGYVLPFTHNTGVWRSDGRTDRQTDRQTSCHGSLVKKAFLYKKHFKSNIQCFCLHSSHRIIKWWAQAQVSIAIYVTWGNSFQSHNVTNTINWINRYFTSWHWVNLLFWISLSLRLSLSPRFGLRPKITTRRTRF